MSQERTEEPTPRRIKQARERGQVALSRDLLGGLSILVLAMALPFTAQQAGNAFTSQLALSLEAAREGEVLPPSLPPWSVGAMVLKTLLPVLTAIMLAGTLASIAQTGPLWAPKAIGFDPKRLDLIAGVKRLLGKDNWIELLRTLLKLLIISWVCIRFLWNQFPRALSLAGSPAQVVLHRLGESTKTLLLHGGAAISALGAVDFLYRRAKWWQDLRMTKAEAKQEYKDTEGDPHAKAERERVRQEIAQNDLAEAVRRATVVVVNPTRLAVALHYDETSEDSVPQVVAKGMEERAHFIRRIAEEAGVPIVRDVPLAQGLFELEVGEEIPERLYEAVAAVLWLAWLERGDGESPQLQSTPASHERKQTR